MLSLFYILTRQKHLYMTTVIIEGTIMSQKTNMIYKP